MLEDSPTGRCLEVEITPEMIEAGENELERWEGILPTEGVVRALYIAMVRAAPRSQQRRL